MSFSPICQCIASAARHGMAISSAILAHMSALNLSRVSIWAGHTTELSVPFVQPSKLILTIFVPLTTPFEVVLVMKTTRDGTSTRKMFADVLPLHSIPAELDNLCIFIRRPFGLLLCWRFRSQGGWSVCDSLGWYNWCGCCVASWIGWWSHTRYGWVGTCQWRRWWISRPWWDWGLVVLALEQKMDIHGGWVVPGLASRMWGVGEVWWMNSQTHYRRRRGVKYYVLVNKESWSMRSSSGWCCDAGLADWERENDVFVWSHSRSQWRWFEAVTCWRRLAVIQILGSSLGMTLIVVINLAGEGQEDLFLTLCYQTVSRRCEVGRHNWVHVFHWVYLEMDHQ